MAFALNAKESLGSGIARVVREELAMAIASLRSAKAASGASPKRDTGIHEARRSIKKLRSLLRMTEPRLGTVARQEIDALGAAGRLLGAARDSAASLEVIDSLEARRRGRAPSKSLAVLRRRLSRTPSNPASELDAALKDLQAIKARTDEWPELPNSFGFLGEGLRETYRRGKSALRKVHLDQHPEAFHTLRKRVKDHWYQVRLFEAIWGAEPREAELRELQECLGDEHNLTVLEESAPLAPSVKKLVDQARTELRTRALFLAGGIYAEKPRDHAHRIHGLFEAWRQAPAVARKGPGGASGRSRKKSAA